MDRSLVYGPVPSRRFGISLGVDVVPRKVCSLDCVYCQVGPTTTLTTRRDHFVEPEQIVDQVRHALGVGPSPQIITLAGSGEPTLHAGLAEIVEGLRRITELPLALLTSGALLWQRDVRDVALRLDLVAPSLDAADPETFRRVNRPAAGLQLERIITGLRAFCDRYAGRCRLEVLLVKGINDSPASLGALASLARTLRLEAVDLNTVVRPPPAGGVEGLDRQELERALAYFEGCPAEIIVPYRGASSSSPSPSPSQGSLGQIQALVARRPCTAADLCAALGLAPDRVRDLCGEAVARGLLRSQQRDGATYFLPVAPEG